MHRVSTIKKNDLRNFISDTIGSNALRIPITSQLAHGVLGLIIPTNGMALDTSTPLE